MNNKNKQKNKENTDQSIKHGRSKMISNYGGIGSLIDTTCGTVLIKDFEEWKSNHASQPHRFKDNVKIEDARLLQRLKNRFKELEYLVEIPTGDDDLNNINIKASVFPQWHYCTNRKCQKLVKLENPTEYPPKCRACKTGNMEQVRFMLICKNGHITDLPWQFITNQPKSKQEKQAKLDELSKNVQQETADSNENKDMDIHKDEKFILNYEKCCDHQDLRYQISSENTDLSGIIISCKNKDGGTGCGKWGTLSGVFGHHPKCYGERPWLKGSDNKEECTCRSNVVIKSSNSVYYANTINSIYIPSIGRSTGLTFEQESKIKERLAKGRSDTSIIEFLEDEYGFSSEVAKKHLLQVKEGENTKRDIEEIIYREDEYQYFTKEKCGLNDVVSFEKIDLNEKFNGFSTLIRIDRIKKTTVQTSFTRKEPIDVDAILKGDESYDYEVMRQNLTHKNPAELTILPAVESFGEGILFILDAKKLKQWEQQELIQKRVESIKTNAESSTWKMHKKEGYKTTARRVLIHTLSHLLIKELSYTCGYAVSSLQERLYVSQEMSGFLISAFDGVDGYLGGLAKLCNDIEELNRILKNALFRALDCSLDPICYESEGQGLANINRAACHSCTLLPEVSCELSNLFLDRKMLLDEDYGYFKGLIQ